MYALLIGISGAWAQTATWTSGVSFLTASSDAAATIAAAGTNDINVTDKIVENTKMYRLMQKWTGTAFYLYSNTTDGNHGNRLWKSKTAPDVTNANYVWEAQSSGEYWKFYNIGGKRWIARASHDRQDGTGVNALSATTADNAEAFELISASSCDYPPSDFSTVNYVALKATSRTTYLNSYNPNNNFVGWNNAVHAGYYFKFIPVKKVTFTEAVAVNGGDAVSTIYVAADGSDSFTLPSSKLYSINGAAAVTNTEAVDAIAAGTSDITVTVSDNPNRNVTYILNWSDGTQLSQVADVTAYLNASSSEFLPSAMANDFVTLSYSPETITSETSEVVVTATWNGPFQLSDNFASAKWYTVGIHSSYEGANYIWKYDGDKLQTEPVAKDAYHSLSNAHCFAFSGNPYTGITIYNKSAAKYVVKANNATQATFDETGTHFIPKTSKESAKTVANGYSCFLVSDGTFYLNCYANDNFKVNGWHDNDAGSTCWFIPAGQYYLNYIDGLALEAPVGAVGTSSYFTTVANAAGAKSTLTSLRSTIAGALYSDMATLATVNNQLDPVRNAGKIALTDGYYRIVNAYSSFTNKPAMYFDSSYGKIRWSVDANRENNINAIFKFARTEGDNAYSIYSGNGQNYLSNGGGVLGASTAVTITEAASGTAQYSFYLAEGYNNNHHYLHTLGHNNGAGTSGDLTAWDAGANSASAWYIVKVDELPLTLNNGDDGNFYATLCLPFTVTLDGCNAYTMTLSGNFLVPSKEAITTVPAGTPVLLRGKSATATAQIATTAATGAPLTETALTGSYVPTSVSNGLVNGKKVYTLGKVDNEGVGFYHFMGSSIRANCAYLLLDKNLQVRGFRFDFGGTDAITHVVTPTKPDAPLYDLQGRRVGNATHGIYIQNGKKILK